MRKKLDGLSRSARMAAVRAWVVGWAVEKFAFTRSSGKNQAVHIARVMSLAGNFEVPYHVEIAAALHDMIEYAEEKNEAKEAMRKKLEAYAEELGDILISALERESSETSQLDLRDLMRFRVIRLVELVTETRDLPTWEARKREIEDRLEMVDPSRDLACLLLILKTEGLMEAVGVLTNGKTLSDWSKGTYEENVSHYQRMKDLFGKFEVPSELLELYSHYLMRFKELAHPNRAPI